MIRVKSDSVGERLSKKRVAADTVQKKVSCLGAGVTHRELKMCTVRDGALISRLFLLGQRTPTFLPTIKPYNLQSLTHSCFLYEYVGRPYESLEADLYFYLD